MAEAYIVAAARTAGGRRGGRLSGWHPADLAAHVIDALFERTNADPVIMLEAPLPATHYTLKKAGMKIDDIDLFEVNETFASVPVAWLQDTGADPERLNVNGGAIALGHPLGASGTRLTTIRCMRCRPAASATVSRRCAKAAARPM